MKDFLIVTYVDFWRGGAGHISRVAAMIDFLQKKVRVTVLFIGLYKNKDNEILKAKYESVIVHFLEKNSLLDINTYAKKAAFFLSGKTFDVAVLEYLEMYHILPYLPTKTIKVLDTHDLISDRIESFKRYSIPYFGMNLHFNQEINLFSKFDYIILINKNDFIKVSSEIPEEKLMYIPHPVNFEKSEIRRLVKNITYVASAYPPNVDAIIWFLNDIWPRIVRPNLFLNIYGLVVNSLKDFIYKCEQVNFFGFIEDINEVYHSADIIVNPIRAGAGLKIKNIEAIGCGLPLVTTSHGVSGIEEAHPSCLMVADTADEYILALNSLIDDFDLRRRMSENAQRFSKQTFSEDLCFEPLFRLIK